MRILLLLSLLYIYTCIVDNTTTPSQGQQKEHLTPKHSSRPLPHEGITIWTCT